MHSGWNCGHGGDQGPNLDGFSGLIWEASLPNKFDCLFDWLLAAPGFWVLKGKINGFPGLASASEVGGNWSHC